MAFFSEKHLPAEENYKIYDQKLCAIVKSLEQWRPECEGSAHPIKILTDHKNLEYFMTSKLLNRRQTRWSEFLSCFKFKIVHRPGKQGQKPDALTRMPGDIPPKGGTEKTQQNVLKMENPDKELCKSSIVVFAETVNIDNDSISPEELWNWVKNKQSLEIFESQQAQPTDKEKLKQIQKCHDSPVAGHQGRAKTYDLLSRRHSWNQMRKDVDC